MVEQRNYRLSIPGDMGISGSASGRCTVNSFDMDACVTVELLLLEPPELLVAVVVVEMREGEVRRPLAAARTAR
jgi:hypothetical protein